MKIKIFAIFLCIFIMQGCTAYKNGLIKGWNNFDVVHEERVYRSSQPNEAFLRKIVKEYKIKAVLALKNTPDYERSILGELGIIFYQIPISAGSIPSPDIMAKIESIIYNEENYPLLIHCAAGADRTGLVVALYRINVQNWTYNEATGEMLGYKHLSIRYPHIYEYLKKRALEKAKNPPS